MDGFTIKCNNCGKEIIVFKGEEIKIIENQITEEIEIECDCGNKQGEFDDSIA